MIERPMNKKPIHPAISAVLRPAYNRSKWLQPVPVAPGAHQIIARISSSRLAGKELAKRRPPLKLTLVANSDFILAIHPKLVSSPQGWRLDSAIPVKLVSKTNAITELIVSLRADDSLSLRRFFRNDQRNAAAVELITETLARFVADPVRAIANDATHCGFCGRALTEPKSREWGIGPECRRDFEQAIQQGELRMEKSGVNANQSTSPRASEHAPAWLVDRANSIIDNSNRENMNRILAAGYPLVRRDEDNLGKLHWWAEDSRERDLETAWQDAMDGGDEQEMDQAFKRLLDHQDDIVNRTMAALRHKPNLGDLCDLIDAAAKCGSAGIPDSAAGSFLQTIAKMAFKEIAGNEKAPARNRG